MLIKAEYNVIKRSRFIMFIVYTVLTAVGYWSYLHIEILRHNIELIVMSDDIIFEPLI